MENRFCNCCGAPLKGQGWGSWVCEYCGAKFNPKEETEEIFPGCIEITAQTEIEDYWIRNYPEKAKEKIMEQLVTSLADKIKEYIVIQENFDLRSMKKIYRGSIRIMSRRK